MRFIAGTVATLLALCLVPTPSTSAGPTPSTGSLSALAERLVRSYHAGDTEALRPYLASELVFRDPRLRQRFGCAGFLELVEKMGEGERDRELEIDWVGVGGDLADVRGTLAPSV